MKTTKNLLTASIAAVLTMGSISVSASTLQWNDGLAYDGLGGLENIINFDELDLNSDVADVTQTDADGNGNITGNDTFVEMGSTNAVAFNFEDSEVTNTELGLNVPVFGLNGYELWFDYSLTGKVSGTPINATDIDLNIDFATGAGELWLDDNVDGTYAQDTKIFDYSLKVGHCDMTGVVNGLGEVSIKSGTTGACNLTFDVSVATAGYIFDDSGNDLFGYSGPFVSVMDVTVEDLIGLNFFYAGGPGSDQDFNIRHDGNQEFVIPEPGSLALLGLGLLGVAGANRRKKA